MPKSLCSERLAKWLRVHPELHRAAVDDLYVCRIIRVVRLSLTAVAGSFDSSVHISEEASNAAVAVPWAIVGAIGIAGVLGWGQYALYARVC